MPYFPTYDEMQEALDSARLKMWHEHGKQVDFGGPEFVLYAMEGLGKMEAPKILDEPIGPSDGPVTDQEAAPSEGKADEPTKVTVTKSFGIEGGVAEVVSERGEGLDADSGDGATGDGAVDGRTEGDDPQDVDGPEAHAFRSDRSGKRCIDCRELRAHRAHELPNG